MAQPFACVDSCFAHVILSFQALHVAAQYGKAELVSLLLELGLIHIFHRVSIDFTFLFCFD